MGLLTNTILIPPCSIDKIRKHEFGLLVCRGFGRDDDQDNKKRDE